MIDTLLTGLGGLSSGTIYLFTQGGPKLVMLAVATALLYFGVKKQVEPLLLVPIGFGCMLVNIPLSDLMDEGGFLRTLYDAGIANELFPLLIFVGIGAMIDCGALLENPRILLFGAAGQIGSVAAAAVMLSVLKGMGLI